MLSPGSLPRGEGALWDWCPLRAPGHAPPPTPLYPQTAGTETGPLLRFSYSLLIPPSQGEGTVHPEAQLPLQGLPSLCVGTGCPLTRAPGGTQGTLLAPGLAILAAAFCVGGAAPVQGLTAHIIGDFFPADVHVDVMVRQVLWWHRKRPLSPPVQVHSPCGPAILDPLTHAAGIVHAALLAEVQGEGRAAEAVERALRVYTFAILTGHVLALVMICGGRKTKECVGLCQGGLPTNHFQGKGEVAPCLPLSCPKSSLGDSSPGVLSQEVLTYNPRRPHSSPHLRPACYSQRVVPGRGTPSKTGAGWQGWVSNQLWG